MSQVSFSHARERSLSAFWAAGETVSSQPVQYVCALVRRGFLNPPFYRSTRWGEADISTKVA